MPGLSCFGNIPWFFTLYLVGSLGVALRLWSCVCVMLLTLGATALPQTHSEFCGAFWWRVCYQRGLPPLFLHLGRDGVTITSFSSIHVVRTRPALFKKTPPTVSLGKSFGSKGEQHHKHTASETQSHTQWSHQMQRKPWNISKAAQTWHKYQPDHHWPMST